jgi:hypothetical protein
MEELLSIQDLKTCQITQNKQLRGLAILCCTIHAMSCMSSSCEEIGSVQLLPHKGCIEEDLDRAHPFSEIMDCA